MGLFGFGREKKEVNKEENKDKQVEVDYRWDKYYLKDAKLPQLGDVVYITKSIVFIKTEKEDKELQPGMYIHIDIGERKLKTRIIDVSESHITLALPEELEDIEFIKKHTVYLKSYKGSKKITVEHSDLQNVKIPSDLIFLFNLLAELEDPDIDATHLKILLDHMTGLKNKIIEIANSAAEGAVEEIKSIEAAILRLGLDKLKKIVSEYFDIFIASYKPEIESLENISQLNLTKIEVFKEFAPLISFQIKRKAGIILLLLDLTSSAASIFYKKDSNYKNILKDSIRFYSYPLRKYERAIFGEDFLSLNYKFINQNMKPLTEVYDSYILGHLMLYPMLDLEKESLNMSNRNLKRAYLYYLTFLAVNYLVYNDKKSGYILYNRLRRFGMSVNESVDFLNKIVFAVNKSLSNIGIKPYLHSPVAVSYNFDITKIFPESADFKTVYDRFTLLGQGEDNRLVLRSEDINFSSMLFWFLINDSSIGLSAKTFAVLPAKAIHNPDSLLIENLSSFDIIYLKGLDDLGPNMYREFYKLWKNFEGIIVADYSYYSFLDFDKKRLQLFHIIKDKRIDLPFYTQNRKAYEFAVKYVQDSYTWLTGKTDYKNIQEIFNSLYDIDSIYNLIYD